MVASAGLLKIASITLDIEKGDTLLGGRFKNMKTIVEDIGTDELGQPTINGKKLLSFRILKNMPKTEKSAHTMMTNFERGFRTKLAYGGVSDDTLSDRWYDGGTPWSDSLPKGFNKDPKLVADLTKRFSDAAARQGANVAFLSDGYGNSGVRLSPKDAIQSILKRKKLDMMDSADLPNYYELTLPRKPRTSLLEKLRLQSPGVVEDWPEGHPSDLALQEVLAQKTAAYTQGFMDKLAELAAAASPNGTGKPVGWAARSNFSGGGANAKSQFNNLSRNAALCSASFNVSNGNAKNVRTPKPVEMEPEQSSNGGKQ